MRCWALDTLACPTCHGSLNLQIFDWKSGPIFDGSSFRYPYCENWCGYRSVEPVSLGGEAFHCKECFRMEVMEGLLQCSCGACYPVIRGVPRLLPAELQKSSMESYPEFFTVYGTKMSGPKKTKTASPLTQAKEIKGKEKTIYRFSYEWNEFKDYDENNFSDGLGQIEQGFFKGKRVLDAGCGAGRHALESKRQGARDVIAMDLSASVDAAFEKTLFEPCVHPVQGDMFHLPVRRDSLDIIYSLWALPHTHNPPGAFQAMIPYLNQDGTIIVFLYDEDRRITHSLLGAMRRVTTYLPNHAVRVLGLLLSSLDYSLMIYPYKFLSSWGLEKPLRRITPSHIRLYARRSFHVCYTDWIDRLFYPYVHYYSRDDASRWLKRARLIKTSVTALEAYGLIMRGSRSA